MNVSSKLFKHIINLYPPYLGAGVKVEYIAEDWKELHVSMVCRWYNRNAVGTHFGGSLYSMVDPHLMLLLMRLLGKEYLVWDKSASIKFIKATQKKVSSVIKISNENLQEIKDNTKNGEKYLPKFLLEIKDTDNDIVAIVEKEIYIRKKLPKK
ncbi:MAG: DUF4442 domain-containing protein [Calditrichaeota bacterium]|nr:MAG: DUF4442 domain-containing protein [Calditrichota bacterium]MBL1207002.1 DUF4442 domain-containing protein [Calditrichota bacterium]NOG46829.1 DUF4442 domain-containing protein [Calditrichota bacterium]